jgi:dolichol-phosphate mannosyltransferase
MVALVIPTYNEADNIVRMIHELYRIIPHLNIIIVDDNSPDGTGRAAENLRRTYPRLEVIHRRGKGGRGGATIAGFKRALAMGADLICEMDADFSHNPQELPRLLDKSRECDLVIGSRYLPSSRIVNWPWLRRFFSKLANLYARALLGIPIKDYTNGYRCFRRATLQAVDFSAIDSSGYIVLSEIAMQIHRRSFTIGEVPTVFVNRVRGESNLSKREVWSAFSSVLRLWWRYQHQ